MHQVGYAMLHAYCDPDHRRHDHPHTHFRNRYRRHGHNPSQRTLLPRGSQGGPTSEVTSVSRMTVEKHHQKRQEMKDNGDEEYEHQMTSYKAHRAHRRYVVPGDGCTYLCGAVARLRESSARCYQWSSPRGVWWGVACKPPPFRRHQEDRHPPVKDETTNGMKRKVEIQRDSRVG